MKTTQQAHRATPARTANLSRAQRATGRSPAFGNVADFGRQQAVVATESASALFRGFEAMCRIQEKAAHAVAQRHADVARKLGGNGQPVDMMAVQSELLRFDFDAVGHYWQQLAAAALEMQTEIMGCASHLIDTESVFEAPSVLHVMPFRMPGLDAFLAPIQASGKARPNGYQPNAEAS